MSGIKNLDELLKSIDPVLLNEDYVFTSVGMKQLSDVSHLKPLAIINEDEGLTLILKKETADENTISYESVFRKITMNVNSSLLAVGLTSTVTKVLTEHNIPANVVAAYFHDHIFVPVDKAESALLVIKSLGE